MTYSLLFCDSLFQTLYVWNSSTIICYIFLLILTKLLPLQLSEKNNNLKLKEVEHFFVMNVQTKFMYPLRWTLEGFLVILLKKHEDFVNMFWRSHFWFNYLKGVWSLHFRLSWFILLHHLLLQWVHLCPIIHSLLVFLVFLSHLSLC